MSPNAHGLTCDLGGCDQPAFARYRHVHTGEWIDVCALHRPTFGGRDVAHLYHTVHHDGYPCETPSEFKKPNAFIRKKPLP